MFVQHVPRVGFKAKKKELDNFKAAIEMYEADPEMNPMTIVQVLLPPSPSLLTLHMCLFAHISGRVDAAHISRLNKHFEQAHVLAKYGIMPPESDSARDWQAWYRETTDKAQILSDQVAMLASPLVDAPHRWDHGRPDDWCGSGGCRTLAHEKRGDRYVAKSPAPDRLEKALRGKMTSAVLSGVDAGGRLPTEVTISADPARQDEGEEYHRRLPVVRARDDDDARDDGYRTSDDWRDDRGPRKHEAYRWHDDEEELRDYQRDYERDHESQRSDRGYEERDRPVRYDHVAPREETAPVKQLYGKVDQLQDEVSHLVKMLSRRQLAQTAEERGDVRNERADDEARERQHARRAPESEAFREHAGVVRMGNTERHDAHAEKARLAASHVIDWLRGAILAAKV